MLKKAFVEREKSDVYRSDRYLMLKNISILCAGLSVPFRDVLRGVALRADLVKDQPQLAALFARGDAVQADVELGAVGRVGKLWVGVRDAVGLFGVRTGPRTRTLKAAVQDLGLYRRRQTSSSLTRPQNPLVR